MEGSGITRGNVDTSASMPFIITSNVEKVDPATRKLIRSFARRGKGQKRVGPRKERQAAGKVAGTGRTQADRVGLDELVKVYTSLVPRRVGSDLSFVELPDGAGPAMGLRLIKLSPTLRRIIFPLRVKIGLEVDHRGWLYPISQDAVALHFTAFALEGLVYRLAEGGDNTASTAAMLHFEKGMRLLRERLLGTDDDLKISDPTISVVLKLALAAHLEGDHRSSIHHVEGLRKMMELRGGPHVFRGTELMLECVRCDLGIAVINCSPPVLIRQLSDPVPEYPKKLLSTSDGKLGFQTDNTELIQNLDDDLATCWQVMKRFCLLVNLGSQTQRLIQLDLIYETMAAVLYRLIHMNFAVDSLDRIVRHGLLAFSYHVFLQWQDVKLPNARFPIAYKDCIQTIKPAHGVSSQLMLWLLVTGANSLFNLSDEKWLGEGLRAHAGECQLSTWKDTQDILKSFMWVSLLDDKAGRQIYDTLRLGTRQC